MQPYLFSSLELHANIRGCGLVSTPARSRGIEGHDAGAGYDRTHRSQSGRPLSQHSVSSIGLQGTQIRLAGLARMKRTLDDLEAWLVARVELLLLNNLGADALADALGDGSAIEPAGNHGGRGRGEESAAVAEAAERRGLEGERGSGSQAR